jgi:3-oxoacyl-[acyl-carrier-protein] synthase-3
MRYSKVYLESMGYEIPPYVITTDELEERIKQLLDDLHIPEGQLEALTGIKERRWWPEGFPLSKGPIEAAKKAFEASEVTPEDVGVLIYGGVCRENLEPATACCVASSLGIRGDAAVYDISNACLGVLNGIIDIANRIELGQIRAGLVVSCESAREINDIIIKSMLKNRKMDHFISCLATLTGGSGAVAMLLTDGSFKRSSKNKNGPRKLLGGVTCSAPEFHKLCRWWVNPEGVGDSHQFMYTDSIGILKNGVELGKITWEKFLKELNWSSEDVDKVICHQVGSSHRESIMKSLGIPIDKDFPTFPFLGNIGTVSLPISAAIAEEREFLQKGDKVGFLGIGSGLNTIMLGWEW